MMRVQSYLTFENNSNLHMQVSRFKIVITENNYKWSITFKDCESLYYMPETHTVLYFSNTSIRKKYSDFLSLFTFMHWRRKWQPTPVLLPGKSHGRGSLVSCRVWGHTESDTTEVTQQQQQQYSFISHNNPIERGIIIILHFIHEGTEAEK